MEPRFKTIPDHYDPFAQAGAQPQAPAPAPTPAPPQAAQAGGVVTEGVGSLVILGLAVLGGYVVYKNYVKK